jgi:hypothetical protein
VKRELTIYTTSVNFLDLSKQRKKIIAEIRQKTELGNHNFFCGRRRKKEKSLKPKLRGTKY